MKIFTTPIPPAATLTAYLHQEYASVPKTPRRAVIICPGGGYEGLSEREDEPFALAFAAEGFQPFVLHYSLKETAANYAPLIEVCSAVRYVREHAEELCVDPEHIFTVGFSSGGHCAASAGTLWDHPAVQAAFGDVPTRMGRPDGMILSYPVISSGDDAHRSSFWWLAGRDSTPEQQAEFSLELHVNETTPPTFLWHTADDGCVPVQNSLLYASALAAHHVPVELHIWPCGTHGLALCDKRTWVNIPAMIHPVAKEWFSMAVRWAKEL